MVLAVPFLQAMNWDIPSRSCLHGVGWRPSLLGDASFKGFLSHSHAFMVSGSVHVMVSDPVRFVATKEKIQEAESLYCVLFFPKMANGQPKQALNKP